MDACDKQPSDHKKHMQDFLEKLQNSKTSPVITDSKFLKIVEILQGSEAEMDFHFKAWVKRKCFQLVSLPGLGVEKTLVVPNPKKVTFDMLFKNLKICIVL